MQLFFYNAFSFSKACFSQWYASTFTEDGIQYLTSEHYMMAEKAKLFDDTENYQKIIHATNLGEAKALGRNVLNFDEVIWLAQRFEIVVRGNFLKFSQNKALGKFLANTGKRVLIEASPIDKIWGVGLAIDDPNIENPNYWQGLNLLGFA
ncbi:NADAR family protein, partial [Candidatus Albibeggiatoa sp. nov. BB20]|uniref:NADAR family protein n=1 Tax=Candidatus Albibeggiatoa sp. nov. BB20 TaxID=3162723 RepID=UPI003365A3DA